MKAISESLPMFDNIRAPQRKESQMHYWTRMIFEAVHVHNENTTLDGVHWRIKRGIYPNNTEAVKDFYFRLLHENKDPRSPYENFAHAFYARTKLSPDFVAKRW